MPGLRAWTVPRLLHWLRQMPWMHAAAQLISRTGFEPFTLLGGGDANWRRPLVRLSQQTIYESLAHATVTCPADESASSKRCAESAMQDRFEFWWSAVETLQPQSSFVNASRCAIVDRCQIVERCFALPELLSSFSGFNRA